MALIFWIGLENNFIDRDCAIIFYFFYLFFYTFEKGTAVELLWTELLYRVLINVPLAWLVYKHTNFSKDQRYWALSAVITAYVMLDKIWHNLEEDAGAAVSAECEWGV